MGVELGRSEGTVDAAGVTIFIIAILIVAAIAIRTGTRR